MSDTKDKNSEKDFSSILTEATKDILSEDVQKEIAELFEKKIEEASKDRIEISTKKALLEMDVKYKEELEKLIEAVDATHSNKIEQLSERIDDKIVSKDKEYAKKLIKVKEHYERILERDSKDFKKSVLEAVDAYVNEHIDELIPKQQIQEAVQNKQSKLILEEIRRLVSVNSEFVHEDVKKAMKDAKIQIEEAKKENVKLKKNLKIVKENLDKTNTEVLIESKCSKFSKEKKAGIKSILEGKSADYIQKNFDYVVNLYEKKEQKELQNIRESVSKDSKNIDVDTNALEESTKREISSNRNVIEESVDNDPMEEYENMLNNFGSSKYGQ
jgi:hypothetical protein